MARDVPVLYVVLCVEWEKKSFQYASGDLYMGGSVHNAFTMLTGRDSDRLGIVRTKKKTVVFIVRYRAWNVHARTTAYVTEIIIVVINVAASPSLRRKSELMRLWLGFVFQSVRGPVA